MNDDESLLVSGTPEPFTMLPVALMDDPRPSPAAKFTYWYLKRITSNSDGKARVSMGRLAERIGLARTNRAGARARVQELIDTGWAHVVPRKGDRGDLVNEYVLRHSPHSDGGWSAGEPPPGRKTDHPVVEKPTTVLDVPVSRCPASRKERSARGAPAPEPSLPLDLPAPVEEQAKDRTAKDVVARYVDSFRAQSGGQDPLGADIRKIGKQAKQLLGEGRPVEVLMAAAGELGRSRFSDLLGEVRQRLNGSSQQSGPPRWPKSGGKQVRTDPTDGRKWQE